MWDNDLHYYVRNPAFDVTSRRYLSGIVTENGIARPVFTELLHRTMAGEMLQITLRIYSNFRSKVDMNSGQYNMPLCKMQWVKNRVVLLDL